MIELPVGGRAVRWKAAAGVAVLLGSLVASPSMAGRITLEVEAQCRPGDAGHGATCAVTLNHSGDEEAIELEVALELDRAILASRALEVLQPGTAERFELSVPRSALRPGRNPLVVRVGYHDLGGYPLEVVSHAYLDLPPARVGTSEAAQVEAGPTPPGAVWLAATLEPVRLRRGAEIARLQIRNPSPEAIELDVRWILPATLAAAGGGQRLRIAPGETLEVPLEVENRTAFAGTWLRAYALIESDSAGLRRAEFVPTRVVVEAPPGPTRAHFATSWMLFGGLILIWLMAQRHGVPGNQGLDRRRGLLVDALVLVAIEIFLLAYFRPSLLLSSTTVTGGDMASHYPTLRFLVEDLLPSGRILGWMQGNLAGFPIFQVYFPLPFLVMASLSVAMPLQVAFKVGSVLGLFLLPVAVWAFLGLLGFRRPIPAFGALLVVPFLFIESNSVWGGNIPSTLAGEFSYSWGLALGLFFAGVCFRALRTGRGVVLSGVLLAAVALTHAYCLLFAGLWTASWFLLFEDRRRTTLRLARIYLLGFCLAGFWFVPLLAFSGFTTPYSDVWILDSWRQVVPAILWPSAALVGGLFGVGAWHLWRRGHGSQLSIRMVALLALPPVGVTLYFLAPKLGGVDIRFLPMVQLAIGLLAAVAAGRVVRLRPAPHVALLAAAVAVGLWVDSRVTFIPEWIEWNYSGFEARPLWSEFEATNQFLAGGPSDPQVVFEHTGAHNAAGSIRAFESLPHFSGRSTLEGLYIQSGILTPEIFYLQSEISKIASCPLPEWRCGRLDPERAVEHLRQFNVGQIVARSAEVKRRLGASSSYSLQATFGPYEVFGVERSGIGYVVPLDHQPVALVSEHWKEDFFEWFRRPGSSETVLVHLEEDAYRELRELIPDRVESADGVPRARSLDASEIEIEEEIGQGRIRFRTTHPGHPVLIRVAYHPRWQVEGAERILLASPGFMLVYPRDHEVTLSFGAPPLVRFGWLLTALAGMSVAAAAVRKIFRLEEGTLAAGRGRGWPRPRRYPLAVRPAVSWVALAPLLAALVLVWVVTRQTRIEAPPRLFDRGMEAYRQADNELAAHYFERAVTMAPRSSAAQRASFFAALCFYREGRWGEALEMFERSVREYPESSYRAEAEFHIGLVLHRLGRDDSADATFRRVAGSFPETTWGQRALDRLERSS